MKAWEEAKIEELDISATSHNRPGHRPGFNPFEPGKPGHGKPGHGGHGCPDYPGIDDDTDSLS